MDFYATSYSLAHSVPEYKADPPLIRDGTGFIRSLVPTGTVGALASPAVRSLTQELCRPPLPDRHPAWVMSDGREPLPGTVTGGGGSGYPSSAVPTHQIVKFPRSWREPPGRPPCYMRDRILAREHLEKNPPKDYVSEYHSIFKQKPFHAESAGTTSPGAASISGFTHQRDAEGGPQGRQFSTPLTAQRSHFTAPLQLGPSLDLPSNNTNTRDAGTGYPHRPAVTASGELQPPLTKYQVDFGSPTGKTRDDILLPTKISSSGFNSNNPVKHLEIEERTFCSDYEDEFGPPTSGASAGPGPPSGPLTARVQTFYPRAAGRYPFESRGAAGPTVIQAYPLRSQAARSAPSGSEGKQRDGPLAEVVR